jgi:hypothetical protein
MVDMPSVAITSANSGEGGKAGPYVEPHKRKDGPWDEYDLEDAGRHLERAEQIKSNPKFVEAIAAHHEKKAKRHKKLAGEMRGHMKRGLVSEKALAKVSEK